VRHGAESHNLVAMARPRSSTLLVLPLLVVGAAPDARADIPPFEVVQCREAAPPGPTTVVTVDGAPAGEPVAGPRNKPAGAPCIRGTEQRPDGFSVPIVGHCADTTCLRYIASSGKTEPYPCFACVDGAAPSPSAPVRPPAPWGVAAIGAGVLVALAAVAIGLRARARRAQRGPPGG